MKHFINLYKRNKGKMTEAELSVCDYIFDNKENIIKLTITDLANELYLSTATVSRAVKKLGYHNFYELKSDLKRIDLFNETEIKIDNLIAFKECVIQNLTKTAESIDVKSVLYFINSISQAKYVEIYGVGSSYSLAYDFAYKLLANGKLANAHRDWDLLKYTSTCMSSSHLAIFISLSGETELLIDFIKRLKFNHVPVLSITGNQTSRLEKYSDKTLCVDTTFYYSNDIDLSSRISIQFVIEYLFRMMENFEIFTD